MSKIPRPGAKAPPLALPDQRGREQSLAERRGSWVLVYFYPKDDTPGCTIEACSIRDEWEAFERAGIQVLGVSADPSSRHAQFASKHRLPFTLLADEEKSAIKAWGAWGKKKFMGREFDGILRISYLIDPQGVVAKVYPRVKPAEHAAEVLADVEALAGEAEQPGPKAPARGAAKAAGKTTRKGAKKSARKVTRTKAARTTGATARKKP
jgi:peroxiredoxin Q/BCP